MRSIRLDHPDRVVAAAIRDGALVRIRRVWVARPDADVHLVAAARAGVRVSCVTQARRIGLWVGATDAAAHVAAPPHAGRIQVAEGTSIHRGRAVVPRHPDELVDPIENVLALVATCQPFEQALAVWESALNKGLVQRQSLERLSWRGAARRLLEVASPFSDSGLETFVVPRLRWMGLRIVPQAWIAGHRVDFLIGRRLILQIDGGHHVGAQRTSDIQHDAELMLLGFHVVRVGYHQVVNDWPAVQNVLMRAVAQGLHLDSAK